VIDEEDEPADADHREKHRSGHGCGWEEWLRQGARGRQGGHAVAERPEEDAQRPLRGPVPHEADQDPGRELRGSEGQGHEEDGKDDRNDGHDGGGDAAEDDLAYLRVLVRREESLGDPSTEDGCGLLQRGEHRTCESGKYRDQEGAYQESAA